MSMWALALQRSCVRELLSQRACTWSSCLGRDDVEAYLPHVTVGKRMPTQRKLTSALILLTLLGSVLFFLFYLPDFLSPGWGCTPGHFEEGYLCGGRCHWSLDHLVPFIFLFEFHPSHLLFRMLSTYYTSRAVFSSAPVPDLLVPAFLVVHVREVYIPHMWNAVAGHSYSSGKLVLRNQSSAPHSGFIGVVTVCRVPSTMLALGTKPNPFSGELIFREGHCPRSSMTFGCWRTRYSEKQTIWGNFKAHSFFSFLYKASISLLIVI